MKETDVYAALGDDVFRALVAAFYEKIAADPLLQDMFPADLETSKERQFLFLVQFFGGPAAYNERYGPPRLRMRHFPFPIGQPEREAWLEHMLQAMSEVGVPEPWAGIMRQYFERASLAMMNKTD